MDLKVNVSKENIIEGFCDIGLLSRDIQIVLAEKVKQGDYTLDKFNDILVIYNKKYYWITTDIEIMQWKLNGDVELSIKYSIHENSKSDNIIDVFLRN